MAKCKMLGRADDCCGGKCRGWDWFNQEEIQRCDTCDVFKTDDEALAHIRSCKSCQRKLGKHTVSYLLAEGAYGISPLRTSGWRLDLDTAQRDLVERALDELAARDPKARTEARNLQDAIVNLNAR